MTIIPFRRAAQAAIDTPADLAQAQVRYAAHRAANEAARKALVDAAPIRDLQDLLPILDERVRKARAAYDLALRELAGVLLELEERKHG